MATQQQALPYRRGHLTRRVFAGVEPWMYLAPALIILGVFHVVPILYVIWLSFHTGTSFNGAWIGAINYNHLVSDPAIRDALVATVIFTLGTVPVGAAIALGLAMLLLEKLPGLGFFRTVILLPFVTPVVATTVVWQWIFNPQYGFLDSVLYWMHLPTVDWFASPRWAMFILIVYSIWHEVGFTVLVMLAGLTNINKEMREAARIDGANWWNEFRSITIPLMSPWIFFVLVVNSIGAFKVFTQVLTLTHGGPGNATAIMGYVIEQTAFQYFQISYAAAISTAVLVLVSVLTVIQFSASRRRVFYQ